MMARPKKANKDEMATVRIENAFWKLLETESYSDITVLRISQEAGTNRNSFYYHYKDVNDLAYSAFINNASGGATEKLMSMLLSAFQTNSNQPLTNIEPEMLFHLKRVMLCASSDSVFLNHLTRDLLRQIWFEALSIDEAVLTPVDNLQINFIFSGLTTVLGCPEINASPLLMSSLSQTEVGKASVAALKTIALRQSNAKS